MVRPPPPPIAVRFACSFWYASRPMTVTQLPVRDYRVRPAPYHSLGRLYTGGPRDDNAFSFDCCDVISVIAACANGTPLLPPQLLCDPCRRSNTHARALAGAVAGRFGREGANSARPMRRCAEMCVSMPRCQRPPGRAVEQSICPSTTATSEQNRTEPSGIAGPWNIRRIAEINLTLNARSSCIANRPRPLPYPRIVRT
jgi:hypothetical protein